MTKTIAVLILIAMIGSCTAFEMIQESSGINFWAHDIGIENNTTQIWMSQSTIDFLDPAPEGTVYLAWPGA
jgi:hypothetical protein